MIIDILLPAYGRVELLEIAVRSVLAQDDDGWRLLVLDDGGDADTTVEAWFAGVDDPRVEYRRNPVNLGLLGNFRHALSQVTAPWWVMMGADDVMLPGYVRRVRELIAAHPEAGYVHPGVATIDEHGDPVRGLVERAKDHYRPTGRGTMVLGGEPLARSLARGDWMYFPAICWNTAATAPWGFRRDLDVACDLSLAYDVILDGRSIVLDDEVVFHYRRHSASESSVTAVSGSRFVEEAAFFTEMAGIFDAAGWPAAAAASRRRFSSRVNAGLIVPKALLAGDRAGAATLLRHALGR